MEIDFARQSYILRGINEDQFVVDKGFRNELGGLVREKRNYEISIRFLRGSIDVLSPALNNTKLNFGKSFSTTFSGDRGNDTRYAPADANKHATARTGRVVD